MSREEHGNAPRSEDVLHRFGYRQEFRRELKCFASFVVVFSFISISTGIFRLYGSVLNWGGPLGGWTWPIVVLGQGLVALVFAALASVQLGRVGQMAFHGRLQRRSRDTWIDRRIQRLGLITTDQ